MNEHEKAVKEILSNARTKTWDSVKSIELEATEKLRKLYKGKKVKCKCYDSFIDGDDYYFDQEILDIIVHKHHSSSVEYYATVNVMYRSVFWDEDKPPKPCSFYLSNIEKVD